MHTHTHMHEAQRQESTKYYRRGEKQELPTTIILTICVPNCCGFCCDCECGGMVFNVSVCSCVCCEETQLHYGCRCSMPGNFHLFFWCCSLCKAGEGRELFRQGKGGCCLSNSFLFPLHPLWGGGGSSQNTNLLSNSGMSWMSARNRDSATIHQCSSFNVEACAGVANRKVSACCCFVRAPPGGQTMGHFWGTVMGGEDAGRKQ